MNIAYVTLVSKQTIPNVQYIKEFRNQFDQYFFVSTETMEKSLKSSHIIKATSLCEDQVKIIIVSEENFNHIISELKKINFEEFDSIVVNCTLGTKIMSLAVFDYFRKLDKSKLYYTPIGTNRYVNILDENENKSFETKISIKEYFSSYGYEIRNQSKPLFDLEYAEFFKQRFEKFGNAEYDILENLRAIRDKKKIQIDDRLRLFLEKIKFVTKGKEILTKHEIQYLTGGWFEEWTYFKIKKKYQLEDEQIALGVLVKAVADNDLDVVFIINNELYVIECKTRFGRDIQQATLYKSGALIDLFGIAAKSYLFTLENLRDDNNQLNTHIQLRALQQNVKIKDCVDLSSIDEPNFEL